MTYTTDQSIALAREVLPEDYVIYQEGLCMTPEELTALCNKVRQQTLLEAADIIESTREVRVEKHPARVEFDPLDVRLVKCAGVLRNMAGVE